MIEKCIYSCTFFGKANFFSLVFYLRNCIYNLISGKSVNRAIIYNLIISRLEPRFLHNEASTIYFNIARGFLII